jgi:hypothetical protein
MTPISEESLWGDLFLIVGRERGKSAAFSGLEHERIGHDDDTATFGLREGDPLYGSCDASFGCGLTERRACD